MCAGLTACSGLRAVCDFYLQGVGSENTKQGIDVRLICSGLPVSPTCPSFPSAKNGPALGGGGRFYYFFMGDHCVGDEAGNPLTEAGCRHGSARIICCMAVHRMDIGGEALGVCCVLRQ